jgi:hypothetical protein
MSTESLASAPSLGNSKTRLLHLKHAQLPGGARTLTQVSLLADGDMVATAMKVTRDDGPVSIPCVLNLSEVCAILVKMCTSLNRPVYLEVVAAETQLQEEA